MRNVTDPVQVKAQARLVTRRQDEAVADLRRLMAEEWGRRFVWRLIGFCGVHESAFTPDSARLTDFRLGRAMVGQHYLHEVVTTCPEEYLLMQREAQQRAITEETDHDRRRTPSNHPNDPDTASRFDGDPADAASESE